LEGSERVLERIKKIAEAAAIATDTQVEVKMLTAIHEMLVLPESSAILHKNLDWVGPPEFTIEDVEFACKVQRELGVPERGLHDSVIPFQIPEVGFGGGGTDVAEVSWNAPVLQMVAATHPLGSPGHSWAVVCAGKTAIGHKGLLTAAKAMAATGIELMTQPKTLASVRAEWEKLTKDRPYVSPIPPDIKPPVEPEPKKKN
jgi:aminobenzoyl-glutamate utilization protein B